MQLSAALWRVIAGTTLVVLSFSLLNPVMAVRLEHMGTSATAIGFFAMLPYLSVALLVPFAPRLFKRVGVGHAYRIGLAMELVACLGYLFTASYELWCVLALSAGIGSAAAWNATEALIAHNVPATHRGRLTGLYQTALGAAMAVGPLLPGLVGLGPQGANVLAAMGLVVGLMLSVGTDITKLRASREDAPHMSLWSAWRAHPVLAWAALTGGVFEVGLTSVTTAYGSETGLSLAQATSIAGALGMGSFLLQYPAGWLADHMSTTKLFAGAGVILLLSAVGFALSPHWPSLMWASATCWGAVGGALYTLSMIRVAHDFSNSSAVAGTAAMIACYTLGGSVGPLISGVVLDHWGLSGQAGWLGVLAASLLLALFHMRQGQISQTQD